MCFDVAFTIFPHKRKGRNIFMALPFPLLESVVAYCYIIIPSWGFQNCGLPAIQRKFYNMGSPSQFCY